MRLSSTVVLACAAASGGFDMAWAQPASGSDAGPLEEVVVTAQRREQSVQDIPIAISAFSGDRLAELGVTVARDIAAYTPSLQWKGAFKFAAPTIFLRGIGDNTFQANNVSAVGFYFDDVYVSSGTGLNQLTLDLDRVEVLKGPQGTLYGRNTTGGAVNFIARKPEVGGTFTARGSVTAARYEAYSAEAAVEGPLGERTAVRVAASFDQDAGPFRFTELDEVGRDISASAWRALLAFKPTESLDLLLNLRGSRSAADAIQKMTGSLDPVTFGPCARIHIGSDCVDFSGFAGSGDYLEDHGGVRSRERDIDTLGGSIRLDWTTDAFVATSITAYEENDRAHREDLDHAPADWIQNEWLTGAEQFSQELRLRSTREDASTRWIVGAYYSSEELDSFQSFTLRGFGPGALSLVGTTLEGIAQTATQELESAAVFGELYRDLGAQWTLTAGLRYTYEEKSIGLDAWIFDADGTSPAIPAFEAYSRNNVLFPTVHQDDDPDWSEMSGRLALEYRPVDDVMVYGSVARGFKAGGYNGGALLDQAEAVVVDPEFLTAYELGLKSELLDGRLRLNAAAFYYDLTDQQVFVLESVGPGLVVQTLSNAGESSVTGGEAELQFAPNDALLLSLGGSWLDAQFDEFTSGEQDFSGNRLPAAPEFSATGLARYTWNLPNDAQLSLQGDFTYNDDQYFEATNNPVLAESAYAIGNARLEYSSADGRYSVALWGRNLADERYLIDGFDNAAFGWIVYVPGDPRTYGVTISVNLD